MSSDERELEKVTNGQRHERQRHDCKDVAIITPTSLATSIFVIQLNSPAIYTDETDLHFKPMPQGVFALLHSLRQTLYFNKGDLFCSYDIYMKSYSKL